MNKILLIILALLLQCQNSFAARSPAIKKASNNFVVTKIKSNIINIERSSELIYFYGNVIAERQDLSILADKMIVYYGEDSANQTKKKDSIFNSKTIKKIEAKDNVKIFNEEFVATGKQGVYNPTQNNFILEDDVILNKGSSIAKGQKFVYNFATKKSYLSGKQGDKVIIIIDDSNLKDH
jgi:lipopolysaccharide transport protein LptA